MSTHSLIDQLQFSRQYFNSGITKSYSFRRQQLQKLKSSIGKYESDLNQALFNDLKKSPEEAWVTELGFVIAEINYAIKNLSQWMRPERVRTNLLNFPSSSYILKEPLGVVLVIGPWNYPLQLLFSPLVGAIAAGNCTVLKASEFAPETASVMKRIIEETFSQQYVLFVEGSGQEIVPDMMNNFRFDYVFYTGSTAVGKLIYKMAADQLVPVTLELGGKSPCVIESDANLRVAARRIATAKFSNAGQMCVAPDYILVQNKVKQQFISQLRDAITESFSQNPSEDYNYCKIVNEKQFRRLMNFLNRATIVHGGRNDVSKLYIEPTIVEDPSLDSPLMKDEIFGPILPVISFEDFRQAKSIIDQSPDPLAFYIYTSSKKKERQWISQIPAGGVCVNNSSWHLTNPHLPFGGRGSSGFGRYHGRSSFETFSHRKSVMKTPTWFDPKIKHPPFKGKLWLFKKVIK